LVITQTVLSAEDGKHAQLKGSQGRLRALSGLAKDVSRDLCDQPTLKWESRIPYEDDIQLLMINALWFNHL